MVNKCIINCFVRLFFTGNEAYALDVLVFQNNVQMAAKPILWEFNFSNVNTFFCSNKFAWLLDM